jgi:dihydrofolate reductase
MSDHTDSNTQRKVLAWITLSMDGFAAGPGGDMSWLAEHVSHDLVMAYDEGIWRGASTAVMGRTNYEGFFGYWPPVAKDPTSSPRDRDLAIWLDTVEKVVFSRTMQRAEWQNTRVSSDLEGEIRALKKAPGRDILVLNSASIIHALMNSELLDEFQMIVLPVVLGGGLRFFPEGLTPSKWQLASTATFPTGAVVLRYRRA